ncbi:hypothetical protein EAS64_21265 [Trebonia kvetii]|uniref:Uncharacterized protein n=1 Tax=Trebonia kvetii TaxID=2480626 RepID=A0A6P2BXP4_9ACTN|nr:hypothetical protein [Trebonia kvetii]TVZ02996.1 hypothetical protein EAS64_21265 [Trebonia kvetii]
METGNRGTGLRRLAGTGRTRTAVLAAAGTAAAAAVVGLAVPAGAAQVTARPAAVSGTQHFQMMNTSTSQTTINNPLLAWGVITSAGVDHQNANGTDTFHLSGGTFLVKHTTKKGTQDQSFNPKTCLFMYSEKGTFKLGSGSGKYKGISGSGTYALSVIGIGPKLKNGTCNPSQTARALGQQQEIQAVGKIKLP